MSNKDKIFIRWIKQQLIPDLQEAGSVVTAQDFARLIKIIEGEQYAV